MCYAFTLPTPCHQLVNYIQQVGLCAWQKIRCCASTMSGHVCIHVCLNVCECGMTRHAPSSRSDSSGGLLPARVNFWSRGGALDFKNITQDFLLYFCITPFLPRQGRMIDEMSIQHIGAPRSVHSARRILTHTHTHTCTDMRVINLRLC